MDETVSLKPTARSRDAKIILALGIIILVSLGFFTVFEGGVPVFIWVPGVFVGCGFVYLGWCKRCMVCSALSAASTYGKHDRPQSCSVLDE